ncbi:MAG: protein adenylyltransferase SelO family protein [Desulfobacterales bacterium]|jgi:uncharacterized protein YdiU (UPF0061 family)
MTPSSTKNRPDAGWKYDNSYARLPEAFYVRLNPVPVRAPKLVVFNGMLAQFLGLNPDALKGHEGAAVFSGNRIPEGADPLALAYAGHQFGSFTMLGDGRAILLSEQVTPKGERYDIQFKGSGRTPFSRQGDGRAALGPMLRGSSGSSGTSVQFSYLHAVFDVIVKFYAPPSPHRCPWCPTSYHYPWNRAQSDL